MAASIDTFRLILERQVGYTDERKSGTLLLDGTQASPDLLLNQKAEQLCKVEGINYRGLEPVQRLFLTRYRCPICKLLPLYHLNLARPKRCAAVSAAT